MSVLTTGELEPLLFEDVPYGDLATEALRIGAAGCRTTFVAPSAMTVAAIEDAAALLALVGATAHPKTASGESVAAGRMLLECERLAAAVLRACKVSQTLIAICSGVAAAQARRPDTIVCTRKNIPGTKAFSLAAIKAGGAIPHRLGLSEAILVFPEHPCAVLHCGFCSTPARPADCQPGKEARHRRHFSRRGDRNGKRRLRCDSSGKSSPRTRLPRWLQRCAT